MPQDIPVEASEDLAFTPKSLEDRDQKPVFILRAVTSRDKRYHTRLYRENGLRLHNAEALRREVLDGLKALWTDEQFEQHSPIIKAYWDAQDEFELQFKDDPSLVWAYDAQIEAAISELIGRIEESHAPLRKMIADNAEFGQMLIPVMAAIVIKNWRGISHKRVLDRGYLDLECAEELIDHIEEKFGKEAVTELFLACAGRMRLDEETAGNSASGSPSETTPAASTATSTLDSDGPSPASEVTGMMAPSSETPATA